MRGRRPTSKLTSVNRARKGSADFLRLLIPKRRGLDRRLRELLGTVIADRYEQKAMRRKARRMLRKMGFDDATVQRAGDELEPKLGHCVQIERIVSQLGLAVDGDIARLWTDLNDTYGQAHHRSFHERLDVDDEYLPARRMS